MEKHKRSCRQGRKKVEQNMRNNAGGGGIEGAVMLGGALAIASLVAAFTVKKGNRKDTTNSANDGTEGLRFILHESSSTLHQNLCCTNHGTYEIGVTQIETCELVSPQSLISSGGNTMQCEIRDSVSGYREILIRDVEQESTAKTGDIEEISRPVGDLKPMKVVEKENNWPLVMEAIEIEIEGEAADADSEQPGEEMSTLQSSLSSVSPMAEEKSSSSTGEEDEEEYSLVQSSFSTEEVEDEEEYSPMRSALFSTEEEEEEEEEENSPMESSFSTEDEDEECSPMQSLFSAKDDEDEEEEEENSPMESTFSTEDEDEECSPMQSLFSAKDEEDEEEEEENSPMESTFSTEDEDEEECSPMQSLFSAKDDEDEEEEEEENSPMESSFSTEEEEEEDSPLHSSFSTEEDESGENATEMEEGSSEGTWSSSTESNMEAIWPAEMMRVLSPESKGIHQISVKKFKVKDTTSNTEDYLANTSDESGIKDGQNKKETQELVSINDQKSHSAKRQIWVWLGLVLLLLLLLANCLLQLQALFNSDSFIFPTK
ncbi:hypothetical protein PTKIN_Ptkin12aG0138400 [Pterospermum kingtungense]